MIYCRNSWQLSNPDPGKTDLIVRQYGLSPAIAGVLVNRRLDINEIADFLYADRQSLPSADGLAGVPEAVARIARARTAGEKVCIYGDYDVDGITAAALLYNGLRQLGLDVVYYIPERKSEGYGLNSAALEKLAAENGVRLVITVDCGINAVAEVAAAPAGLDIIITDHHQPGTVLPGAVAVINPKRPDCRYPFKWLAGVG
ncbi:MAG: DHH family phosphoesterase, partial [Negativicutes bacterium]|nr:DHH family phosphoesterase [Negativicutes bacterium]